MNSNDSETEKLDSGPSNGADQIHVHPADPVANPEPADPAPAAVSRRSRNGTIARLPKKIRNQLNEMLDDNIPYGRIIKQLGGHGKNLDEEHIRRWKPGGYQDYLREQRLLDQCRHRPAKTNITFLPTTFRSRTFNLLKTNEGPCCVHIIAVDLAN